jgi:nucleolar protein 15
VGRQFSAKRLNAAAASTSSAERSAKRIAAAVAAEVKTSSEEPRAMEVDAATTSAMKRDIAARAGGPRQTPAGAAVLYLGHIPHGFYEEQMKGFFSQFGIVTRLRLARNKKTGRSKHSGHSGHSGP